MKEYIVLKIQCEKDLTIADIYEKVSSRVAYKRNLFAILNINTEFMRASNVALYDSLGLERFAYTFVPEHIRQSTYRYDNHMLSNLDDNWAWGNPSMHESLSHEELTRLITFLDKLKALDLSTMVLGFDEIEWDGTPVGKGTCGYEKADGLYGLGENYLSNAVLIGRDYKNKNYIVHLSCEKRFRELSIIQDLADSLGKIKHEVNYFAPENEKERREWEKIAAEAKTKFEAALAGLSSLPLEKFEKMGTAGYSKKIDIKKYVKEYLCTDGWKLRKALPDEWSTIVCKEKGDATVSIGVSPYHNGHQVQTGVYYRSKMFKFAENLGYITDAHEDQIEIFFRDAKIVRDYLYEVL